MSNIYIQEPPTSGKVCPTNENKCVKDWCKNVVYKDYI